MTQHSAIEWTTHTWNPWVGCTKVSPGCAHCYMFARQLRFKEDPEIVRRTKPGTFRGPLGWKAPAFVFTCSLSDFFHEAADPWRSDAWRIMRATPWLTYQVLTKRPERILEHLPDDWGHGYPNVWLGTTIENARFEYRAQELLRVDAWLHFLSCEPLLGPLTGAWAVEGYSRGGVRQRIRWVIGGGESGAKCRPTDEGWLRQLRDQCAAAEIPFFLKQLGGFPDKRGSEKAILDGRRHLAMPARFA